MRYACNPQQRAALVANMLRIANPTFEQAFETRERNASYEKNPRRSRTDSPPTDVLQRAQQMLDEISPNACGMSEVRENYWIETHTLGCRNAADDPEDTWWGRHFAVFDEYQKDGISIVLGDPADGKFVTITPQLDMRGKPLRYRENPTFAPLSYSQGQMRLGKIAYHFVAPDEEDYFVEFKQVRQPVPMDTPSGVTHRTMRGFAITFFRQRDAEREDEGGTTSHGLGKYGMTGEGGAVPVLGTVMDIIRAFTRDQSPSFLVFTADNVESSRVRLYRRMISRMELPGYEQGHHVFPEERYDASQFYLVRSDLLPAPTQWSEP